MQLYSQGTLCGQQRVFTHNLAHSFQREIIPLSTSWQSAGQLRGLGI